MLSIDNASHQVLFEQRIFPLILISMIRPIFCWSPLLLMGIWCQLNHSFVNTVWTLQLFFGITATYSPIELVTSKIWSSIITVSDLIMRPSLPFIVHTYMFTNNLLFPMIDSFLAQRERLSPWESFNQYEFSALQKASKNDFHEPLGQVLPLPSRVSLVQPFVCYFQAPAMQASKRYGAVFSGVQTVVRVGLVL